MIDKIYAMSSFLQFRMVYGTNIKFADTLDFPQKQVVEADTKINIMAEEDLNGFLENYLRQVTNSKKAALALSGGIDSAILAKFMPKGTAAYTFQCVVPGKSVGNETERAKLYCDINGLEHRVVEIFWEDYEKFIPVLMKHKSSPIHSIEVQIYKAALQAKRDGYDSLIFGDSADMVFGGLDRLLSKDWSVGEFIDRFSYVLPYKALKESKIITAPFEKHNNNGTIDVHAFLNDVFSTESTNSYINACKTAGIDYIDAYLPLKHEPIDLSRIRSGDTKYVVRGAFKRLYPDISVPEKIPMLRAVNEWFEHWKGPKRQEFWENCHVSMTGDQKYYIYILERFLDECQL